MLPINIIYLDLVVQFDNFYILCGNSAHSHLVPQLIYLILFFPSYFIFNIDFNFSSFSFFLAYSHYYLFLPSSLSIWKCYWAFLIKSIFLGTSLVAQWKFPISPLLFNLLFEVLDSIIKQNKEIQI